MSGRLVNALALLLCLVLIISGFVLVLGIGFLLNPPDLLDLGSLLPAAALLFVTSAAGLVAAVHYQNRHFYPRLFGPLKPRRPGPVAPGSPPAVPVGEAQIMTCAHLRPIERDMRAAGITLRQQPGRRIGAICVIDEAALRHRYAISPPVDYDGDVRAERNAGPPCAVLSCVEHGASIWMARRADAPPGVPLFPPR